MNPDLHTVIFGTAAAVGVMADRLAVKLDDERDIDPAHKAKLTYIIASLSSAVEELTEVAEETRKK